MALSIVQGEKAEVFELILPDNSRAINKQIKELHFPRGLIIGSIVRDDEILIPGGETVLLPEDHLIIFSLPKVAHRLGRYFA